MNVSKVSLALDRLTINGHVVGLVDVLIVAAIVLIVVLIIYYSERIH